MASYNNKIEIENVPNFMTYNGKHLFHYTSFLSALKIILSEKLLFGDFKGMNDISESRREVFDDVAIVELNRYKSISFTKDKREKRGFEIDSLWGYYSEKGKGVCLVFNKAKLIMQLRKQNSNDMAKLSILKILPMHFSLKKGKNLLASK